MTAAVNGASAPTTGWLLPALMIGYFAGAQGVALLPMIVGAVVDGFGVSETVGGYVATLQLGSSGLASLCMAARLVGLNRRRMFTVGCSLALLGNATSVAALWLHAMPLMLFSRALDGLGQGIVIATVSAVAAGQANPLRVFAFMNSAFAGVASLYFVLLPWAAATVGASGVFCLCALTEIVALTLCGTLPEAHCDVASEEGVRQRRLGEEPAEARPFWVPLLAVSIFAIVSGGVWAFAERIGIRSAGLTLPQISKITAGAALLFVIGPILANLSGGRLGRIVPVAIGCIGYFAVALGFASLSNFLWYAICMAGHALVCGYFVTYLSGLFAQLDRSGRLVAAAPAFNILGNATGPTLVGSAIPWFTGYLGIGWIAAALLTTAMALLLYTIGTAAAGTPAQA